MKTSPFVALLATAVACLLPGEPASQLALSIDLSTTQVQADTGVVIRLEARNPWRNVIHLTTVGCVLDYYLIGPNGERIDSPWGCDLFERQVDVLPGESIVREFTFYPAPRYESFTLKRWAAGSYRIVGELLGEQGNVVRETEPVTFEIVCHDAGWTEC